MTPSRAGQPTASQDLEYLTVDDFIRTLVDARALKTAFELGLIDHLLERRASAVAALERALGVDAPGLRFLLDLLAANQVIEQRDSEVSLHERFAVALRYRDLLEMKLDFAGFVMNDFADLFTALIKDPGRFTGKATIAVMRCRP